MNVTIETVNRWGEWFASVSFGMLLQSSVLILILATVDWLLRNRARAIVRYSLWMLLLIKLILPVNLSLPTSVIQVSPVLRYDPPEYAALPQPPMSTAPMVAPIDDVLTDSASQSSLTASTVFAAAPPRTEANATLTPLGWSLLACLATSLVLFLAVIWKSIRASNFVRSCPQAPPELACLLDSCRKQLGVGRHVELRVSEENLTPALCGILRPNILLPRSLATTLQPNEVRAVLLHELTHLKRGDLLVNLAQTILQVVYFYHPLLWLANSRIRKLREQAVDEAVLVAMGNEAEDYPATLVNVAKFTLSGRGMSFGTVGIMESKSAFASRIRRMLAQPFPSSARLGVTCIAAMVIIGVCVLPMAGREKEGKKADAQTESSVPDLQATDSLTKPTNSIVPALRAKSLEQLLVEYEVYAENRKRSQAAIVMEIVSRTNALEFLATKLERDNSKSDTRDSMKSREKAAYLLGKFRGQPERAVRALMECFEDDEDVRHSAARSLGEYGPAAKMAVPILLEELHFQNIFAGNALMKIAPDSEEVLNSMIEAVTDPSKNEQFRHQTLFALQSMAVKTPALTAAFDKLAEGPDGTLKDTASSMKGIMPKPRAGGGGIVNTWDKYKDEDLPTIIEKIRADPQDYAAVQALQRFGTNAAPALPVLIELLESKKAQYPGNVVGAIAGLGPSASNAVPVLIRFLDDDDHGVVHNALNSFGRIGPSAIAAKPRLIEFLHDPSPVLCWVAANSLRRVDPAERDLYLPVLLDPIKTDRYAEHFAEYQVKVLGELGESARPFIPKLRQMLAHREPVRVAAAEVLLAIDPSSTPEVVRAMIRTVEDETAMNPQLAAIVLGKVGPPAKDALPSLRKLAAHESEWKAKSAQDAINQIEQKAL